jgi:hypothetical protein
MNKSNGDNVKTHLFYFCNFLNILGAYSPINSIENTLFNLNYLSKFSLHIIIADLCIVRDVRITIR